MQYQGGKSRISKYISEVINEVSRRKIENISSIGRCDNEHQFKERERESNTFVSLFCGTCSVESKITGFDYMILNDKHKYLIDMFNGVKDGYQLPEYVSEEQYKYIREHKDEDSVLTGFVGFGCSFGGKWFGGYARNKTGTNYALQSKKSLMKDMNTLMNARFICEDYRNVYLPDNCVIYADPPYNGTTGYGKEKFDSQAFWEYAKEISKNHLVFVSEQSAPQDFKSIWDKPFTRTLDVNKENQFVVTEHLYVHADTYNMLKKENIL